MKNEPTYLTAKQQAKLNGWKRWGAFKSFLRSIHDEVAEKRLTIQRRQAIIDAI